MTRHVRMQAYEIIVIAIYRLLTLIALVVFSLLFFCFIFVSLKHYLWYDFYAENLRFFENITVVMRFQSVHTHNHKTSESNDNDKNNLQQTREHGVDIREAENS